MRGSRRVRRGALPLLLVAAALAGCTSSPVGAVATSAAPEPFVETTPAPAPTPTTPPPTQTAADATPVSVRCAKLVPKAVARQLVPDLALEKGWEPEAGSPSARLADLGGTACLWTDAAGDRLEVAVAKPSKADAVLLKNDLVQRSNSVPTYGGEAYFTVDAHLGAVDAFRGRTWISVRSNRFFEPGDAIPVMAAVDDGLGLVQEPDASASPAPAASDTAPPAATPAPTPTP